MSKLTASFICFMAGFVVCANLSRLMPTNPNYEAGYGTVAIALFMAIFAAIWERK